MLQDSGYNEEDIYFLSEGLEQGFDIGYDGPQDHRSQADNIPLTVGSPTQLWNKLIKEVKLGRVAGPFLKVPFDNYIQSPIGLVPKAGGRPDQAYFPSIL